MIKLGVNIDHVATIRQARRTFEPDPVWAAVEAQLGGADSITMHLREDRRHIQDHDVERMLRTASVRVNLEMAATDEMLRIATTLKPRVAMLVPEGRTEVTTEGGLDVVSNRAALRTTVRQLKDAGISTSAFIDAQAAQVDAAADVGFDICEIHTGPYAHAFHAVGSDRDPAVAEQIAKVADAGRRIIAAGMLFNAGHALNYVNVQPIASLPDLYELHIGHAIVSRAVFVGLRQAVSDMKRLMVEAAAGGAGSPTV